MTDVEQQLEEATRHHQSGALQAALDLYQAILISHPNHCQTTYQVAVAANQLQKLDVAEQFLKKAIALTHDPKLNLNRRVELSEILVRHQKIAEAEIVLRRAQFLGRDDGSFNHWFGRVRHLLERYEDAVEAFERAAELMPDDPQVVIDMVQSMSRIPHRRAEVGALLERAAATGAKDIKVLSGIGAWHVSQNQFAEAAPYFVQSIKISGDRGDIPDPYFDFSLGVILEALSQPDEAERHFRRAVEICDYFATKSESSHDKYISLAFKGRVLYTMGRRAEAALVARSMANKLAAGDCTYPDGVCLPDTPKRLERLKRLIGGRDVAILAHGPSIAELENKIGDIAGRDICFVGINRFGVTESNILSRIGRRFDIAVPTNPTEFGAQSDRIISFLERDDDNLLITSRYAIACLPRPLPSGQAFEQQFDEKVIFFYSAQNYPATPHNPIHVIPGNTPSVLIPFLLLGEPQRIFLFGGDGGAGLEPGRPSHYRMDTEEFKGNYDEAAYELFRERLWIDAQQFNQMCEFQATWLSVLHGVPRPPIYIVSPNSNYTAFPCIDYDEALKIIGT